MLPRDHNEFRKMNIDAQYISHANLFSTISSFTSGCSDLHPDFVLKELAPNGDPSLSPLHHHDYFQILHSAGDVFSWHTVGNEKFKQMPGQIAIVPMAQKHVIFISQDGVPGGYQTDFTLLHALSRSTHAPYELIIDWAYIRPWFRGGNKYLFFALPPDIHARLCDISERIAAIENIIFPETKNPRSTIVSELYDKVLSLSDEYIACIATAFYQTCTADELRAFQKYRKPIMSALEYIEDNLSNRLSLNDVCDVVGLKTSRFSQLFREIIGFTLSEYVNFSRCRMARVLLINSKLPIGKISKLCGFNSPIYFDRVFKNYNGLSPKVYRDDQEIEWVE